MVAVAVDPNMSANSSTTVSAHLWVLPSNATATPTALRVMERQDCSRCRKVRNCWMPGISARLIATNLLVCRIKHNVQRDAATRMLLEMLRPKLLREATSVMKGLDPQDGHVDFDAVMADLESAVIVALVHHYIVGEIAYPLYYLFGPRSGVVTHFAAAYAQRQRKQQRTFVLAEDVYAHVHGHEEPAAPEDDIDARLDRARTRDVIATARQVIDDGLSLSLDEFRVMRFCLTNADETSKRPTNGLHAHIATRMGLVRSWVTKLAADATRKIVDRTRRLEGHL